MTMSTAGLQDCATVRGTLADTGPVTAVSLQLEHSPTALARVSAILCTVGLVPASMSAQAVGDEVLQLDLCFRDAAARRVDLLLRKLAQLVECIELRHAPGD